MSVDTPTALSRVEFIGNNTYEYPLLQQQGADASGNAIYIANQPLLTYFEAGETPRGFRLCSDWRIHFCVRLHNDHGLSCEPHAIASKPYRKQKQMNNLRIYFRARYLCLALTLVTPLCATTINFDDQATAGGAVQLSNQYSSSGVLFNDIYAAQNFKFNIIPPSTPNYASPFWTDLNPGLITFVDPSNSLNNATVNTVSFTLVGLTASAQHPGNFSGATVDAIDLSGNVIAGDSVTIPGTDVTTANQIFTFTGDVHELRFTHIPTRPGALPIDDLVFGALTACAGTIGIWITRDWRRVAVARLLSKTSETTGTRAAPGKQ